MLKTYKYRLYPDKGQRVLFSKAFGCSRYIYNWALETKTREYAATGKSPSRFDLNVRITSLKVEHRFLSEVSDWVLKCAIDDLERAFANFFEKRAEYPRFKAKGKCRDSFRVRGARPKDGRLFVPRVGRVRCVFHRPLIGETKTCTVLLAPSGKYFACIQVEDGLSPVPPESRPPTAVGVDVGIKSFCTLSTGEKILNPKHLAGSGRRLAKLQRDLSRKEKGSNRYKAAKVKVARAHERVADQRRDFHHKLSSRLVHENQVIAVEDLNVKGMVKKHRLAKAISDAGWSQFLSMLEYKASWYGSEVIRCGRFDPSSRLCTCGSVNKGLALAERTWTCPECGAVHDRDVLAANNILKFAVASTVNGRGGSVRLAGMLSDLANVSPSCPFEASSPRL
jgi:putative transposase